MKTRLQTLALVILFINRLHEPFAGFRKNEESNHLVRGCFQSKFRKD